MQRSIIFRSVSWIAGGCVTLIFIARQLPAVARRSPFPSARTPARYDAAANAGCGGMSGKMVVTIRIGPFERAAECTGSARRNF